MNWLLLAIFGQKNKNHKKTKFNFIFIASKYDEISNKINSKHAPFLNLILSN